MNIRVGKDQDVIFLKRLLVQLGYPDLSETDILNQLHIHQTADYRLLVVEQDQEVVGFLSLHWFSAFHRNERIGYVTAFCVDDRLRGKGIGTALLDAAEHELKSEACQKIQLTSNNRRTETHAFYLRRGYLQSSKKFTKDLL